VWRIDSGVEAMAVLGSDKNIALFETMNVMSKAESLARVEVMLQHYTGTVDVEAKTMVDMIQQYVLPDCKKAALDGGILS